MAPNWPGSWWRSLVRGPLETQAGSGPRTPWSVAAAGPAVGPRATRGASAGTHLAFALAPTTCPLLLRPREQLGPQSLGLRSAGSRTLVVDRQARLDGSPGRAQVTRVAGLVEQPQVQVVRAEQVLRAVVRVRGRSWSAARKSAALQRSSVSSHSSFFAAGALVASKASSTPRARRPWRSWGVLLGESLRGVRLEAQVRGRGSRTHSIHGFAGPSRHAHLGERLAVLDGREVDEEQAVGELRAALERGGVAASSASRIAPRAGVGATGASVGPVLAGDTLARLCRARSRDLGGELRDARLLHGGALHAPPCHGQRRQRDHGGHCENHAGMAASGWPSTASRRWRFGQCRQRGGLGVWRRGAGARVQSVLASGAGGTRRSGARPTGGCHRHDTRKLLLLTLDRLGKILSKLRGARACLGVDTAGLHTITVAIDSGQATT
jgi:hypothetical protein